MLLSVKLLSLFFCYVFLCRFELHYNLTTFIKNLLVSGMTLVFYLSFLVLIKKQKRNFDENLKLLLNIPIKNV